MRILRAAALSVGGPSLLSLAILFRLHALHLPHGDQVAQIVEVICALLFLCASCLILLAFCLEARLRIVSDCGAIAVQDA